MAPRSGRASEAGLAVSIERQRGRSRRPATRGPEQVARAKAPEGRPEEPTLPPRPPTQAREAALFVRWVRASCRSNSQQTGTKQSTEKPQSIGKIVCG